MRWLIYLIVLFVAIDGVVIAYWRDSQTTTSLSSILFYLLALPLLVFAASYSINLGYKIFKNKSEDPSDNPDASNEVNAQSPDELPKQAPSYFRVHATALQTSEGDHPADILAALKSYKAAELDPELVNASGVRILSRRIDITDTELTLDNELEGLAPRFQRIAIIVQRLLQEMAPQLCHLSQGMTQAEAWRASPEFEQPVLHPAWKGQREEQLTQHTEQVIHQIQQWPAHIQISYFLPQTWDAQDHELISQMLGDILQQFDFSPQQFSITPVIVDEDLSQSQWFEKFFEQIKSDEKNIHLVLGADSLIDQDEVDQIIWDTPEYITAEAGYGLLISHLNISIPDNENESYVFINPDEHQFTIKDNEDQSVLLSTFNPLIHMDQIKKLSRYLNTQQLEADQLIFSGSLLESVSHQATGLGLTLVAALAGQENHTGFLFLSDTIKENACYFFTRELNLVGATHA